jgi:hypothetical protein
MITNGEPGAPEQPASETGRPRKRQAGSKAANLPSVGHVRRAAEWGQQKYVTPGWPCSRPLP